MFFLEHCIQKRISAVYRSSNRYWSKRIAELQDKIDSLQKENLFLKQSNVISLSQNPKPKPNPEPKHKPKPNPLPAPKSKPTSVPTPKPTTTQQPTISPIPTQSLTLNNSTTKVNYDIPPQKCVPAKLDRYGYTHNDIKKGSSNNTALVNYARRKKNNSLKDYTIPQEDINCIKKLLSERNVNIDPYITGELLHDIANMVYSIRRTIEPTDEWYECVMPVRMGQLDQKDYQFLMEFGPAFATHYLKSRKEGEYPSNITLSPLLLKL